MSDLEIQALLINDLSQAYEFDTVGLMTASTIVFPVGKIINIKEPVNGGFASPTFTVALTSSVTAREDDILVSVGVPTKSFVRSNPNGNESYQTVEQLTKYTMPANRDVFGEEYLWGLHRQIILSTNTSDFKFVWSGDSTTFGVNATDASGVWDPASVANFMAPLLGLAKSTHINAGKSSATGYDWGTFYVDQDIASHPDMNVYVTRWGINDGSAHGDVDKYIDGMEQGLQALRAHKDVQNLTILVMSPNSTYNPDINRSTDWYEQIVPRLRQICRKYRACFFDTYSIWQDSKQGVDTPTVYWMDDPFANGQTVHPDGYMNHAIVKRVMDMLLKPIQRMGIPVNAFTNNVPRPTFNPLETSPPNFYSYGLHYYRVTFANGWPFTGMIDSQRNDQKVIQTIKNTIVDGGNSEQYRRIAVRYGDIGLNTWTKWYNVPVDATSLLINSWTANGAKTPYYTHYNNGMVVLSGGVTGGSSGTISFGLPIETRPSTDRIFLVSNNAGTFVSVRITAGGDVFINATDCMLDGISFIAGL